MTKTYKRAPPGFKLMPYVCLENNRNPVAADGTIQTILKSAASRATDVASRRPGLRQRPPSGGNEICFIVPSAPPMRSHMHSDPLPSTLRVPDPSGYARERFSVQAERVVLDAQRGWQCTCATFAESHQCPHVEQAQAFRKMRGVRREEDTIELQFGAAQMQELSGAAPAGQTELAPAELVAASRSPRRHSPWTTVAFAAAMSALSSGITYLAATRAEANRAAEPAVHSQALVAAPAPPAAPPREVPVRFVNPFDAGEVFQFPPHTSRAEAREAVAELLLKRAYERQAAERERLERAMSLAEAG